MSKPDYDVIVVGMGIAGHCAALSALEAGARVLMVHAEERVGGSSRLSSGVLMGANTRFQRSQGIHGDHAESFYRFYMAANHWQVQPSVARRLCYEAGPTVDWLMDHGVTVVRVMGAGDEEYPRGHVTPGGESIVFALHGHIQKFQSTGDLALNTRVERLLIDDGTVVGIHAAGQDVTGRAVVLTCGGMGADLDMVRQHQPNILSASETAPRFVGSPAARGDALRLAAPLNPQVLSGRPLIFPILSIGGGYMPSYTVIVNTLGRRCMDESSPYGVLEAIMAAQPGSVLFLLFDDATKRAMKSAADVLRETKDVVPDNEGMIPRFTSAGVDELVAMGAAIKADGLEQLAMQLSVPLENLRGTLTRYNQHCAGGSDEDYLKQAKVLRPVATPPFYALTMRSNVFALTATGLRIDHSAQVIRQDSLPVPGLFAAGEATGGVLMKVYIGSGNSLANCSTFGRIAGRNAAGYASTGAVPRADWAAIEARAAET